MTKENYDFFLIMSRYSFQILSKRRKIGDVIFSCKILNDLINSSELLEKINFKFLQELSKTKTSFIYVIVKRGLANLALLLEFVIRLMNIALILTYLKHL